MEVYLIRHGKTKGNLEHRYVGRTDEDLLPESRRQLEELRGSLEMPEQVYASPLKRCTQTAEILFPAAPCMVHDGLREMDFGGFEYKNYEELNDNPEYRAWVDCAGMKSFCGAEDGAVFRARCVRAFLECIAVARERKLERVAFAVHGGTIMSVLEALSHEKKGYYEWQTANGSGFSAELRRDESRPELTVMGRIGGEKKCGQQG